MAAHTPNTNSEIPSTTTQIEALTTKNIHSAAKSRLHCPISVSSFFN